MKTYVLTVAKHFPAGHPRAGQETFFKIKVTSGSKVHTIRGNYELWKKRIDEVNAGKAILSLRQWTGKPYHTKQVEFMQITKDLGIQRIGIIPLVDQRENAYMYIEVDGIPLLPEKHIELMSNDGLSEHDFFGWFSKTMTGCIIHFGKTRYNA